jgi:dTDP-4-amino-4,6-dideoxygalactose transaminase
VLDLPRQSTILVPNYFQGVEIDTLLHNGFDLRFYRIDAELRIDVADLAARIDDSVSALYVIHYFGWPQPMEAVMDFCRERGLKLIEDCALSLFSQDASGEWLGSYGDLSLYSVYKSLSLPHGGYLVTRRERHTTKLQAAPLLSTIVQTSDLLHQHLRASGWLHVERGIRKATSMVRRAVRRDREETVTSGGSDWDSRFLNYGASRLTEFLMKSVNPDRVIASRRRNYRHLAHRLEDRARVLFPKLPEGVCPLFLAVMVDDKLDAMKFLDSRGVGTVNLWWDDHTACPPELSAPVSHLRRYLLELPIHQCLSDENVDRVADAFLAYLETSRRS